MPILSIKLLRLVSSPSNIYVNTRQKSFSFNIHVGDISTRQSLHDSSVVQSVKMQQAFTKVSVFLSSVDLDIQRVLAISSIDLQYWKYVSRLSQIFLVVIHDMQANNS